MTTPVPRYDLRALLLGLGLGLAALVALHVLLYQTYWDYSEGVYALTARLMLHGHGLYDDVVGAQPPGVFVAGAGLLWLHDSLEWLRFGVALLQLGAGLVAGVIVWRLTESRVASALAPAAVLLTPWAVHEHGALVPELVALPVLLGAALVSVDRRRAPLLGVLCGLLPLIKVTFALPALVLIALAVDRRRSLRWAITTLVAGVLLTFGLTGAAAWRDVVGAQAQTGSRAIGALKGTWAQAAWNLAGLWVGTLAALRYRSRVAEARLLRSSVGLAGAMLLTFLSNLKVGTSLNIAVPVEAAFVPLALTGTVLAARAGSMRWVAGACAAGLAFALAQSVSLITTPRAGAPFLRAGSRPGWGIELTAPQLRAAVATARRCPAGVPYSGQPLLAMVADRSMPADQPDQFIVSHAATLRAVRAQVAAVARICP